MLSVIDYLPAGFLTAPAIRLHEVLAGPSLIHLHGRQPAPLFVSILLHGNEDTGLKAVQRLLANYQDRELPRSLSLFVGNIAAARAGVRRLPEQPDYNRIWPAAVDVHARTPEHRMVKDVVEIMREGGVFASVDIHNNTGLNPYYACVTKLDKSFLNLAALFNRTVIYFTRPFGVQVAAFAELCPAVTLECGKPGDAPGIKRAADFLDALLHLSQFPEHAVRPQDFDLYHTIGAVTLPGDVRFAFDRDDVDLCLDPEIERYNFQELQAGTRFGHILKNNDLPVIVSDEHGRDIAASYFRIENGELVTRKPLIPAMLTSDAQAIRQDCLCYVMERIGLPLSSPQ